MQGARSSNTKRMPVADTGSTCPGTSPQCRLPLVLTADSAGGPSPELARFQTRCHRKVRCSWVAWNRTMEILDRLCEEQVVIERVGCALQTFAASRLRGPGDAGDGPGFLEFFRLFADRHHLALEEEVLFPAIAKAVEVSSDREPLAALPGEHRSMKALMDELAPYLRGDVEGAARQAELAARYGEALLLHIDGREHRALRRVRAAGSRALACCSCGRARPARRLWRRARQGTSARASATWTQVLALGQSRTLSPHSFDEGSGGRVPGRVPDRRVLPSICGRALIAVAAGPSSTPLRLPACACGPRRPGQRRNLDLDGRRGPVLPAALDQRRLDVGDDAHRATTSGGSNSAG